MPGRQACKMASSTSKAGKKKKGGGGESIALMKQEQPLQAILLADSFTDTFRPLTQKMPKVLLPLVNVPMIEYTLEFLAINGVEEVRAVFSVSLKWFHSPLHGIASLFVRFTCFAPAMQNKFECTWRDQSGINRRAQVLQPPYILSRLANNKIYVQLSAPSPLPW